MLAKNKIESCFLFATLNIMESIENEEVESLLPEGYLYHPEGYLWLVLPIKDFDALPENVEFEEKVFLKKDEFHVTVINARAAAKEISSILNKSVTSIEEEIQKLLREYLNDNQIKFESLENDVRLAVSDERESLAIKCRVSGIEGFFDFLQERYDILFATQPTHISIYTLTGKAVGINTEEQMESYERVDLPDLKKYLID